MPRKLFDDQGNEVEVPTEDEIKALNDSATRVADLEKSVKELEEGAHPDWREVRKTKRALEEERDQWKKAAEVAGHKTEPTGVSREDAERIADERAKVALLTNHKESVLRRFGDKREVVEKAFNKLAAGEELSYDKIEEIAGTAARAVGASRDISDTSRSVSSRGTQAPDFGDGKPKDDNFADSEAGKATRDVMGLTPDPKSSDKK